MTQTKITSLDFETANPSRVSICAAGLAVFEDGQLTETPYWLVRPPKGHGWFDEDFIECHGLTHLDVLDAPEFPGIASALIARLTGGRSRDCAQRPLRLWPFGRDFGSFWPAPSEV